MSKDHFYACQISCILTLSQTTNLSRFQAESVWDNNFKSDGNGKQFSKWVENTVVKGEIARLRAISPFHHSVFKDFSCRHVKTRISMMTELITTMT